MIIGATGPLFRIKFFLNYIITDGTFLGDENIWVWFLYTIFGLNGFLNSNVIVYYIIAIKTTKFEIT